MRDDIPVLLRDAAVDPSHTPDFEALAARGRRQHMATRAGTALVAVVAMVAGGLVLWPDGQPARGPVIGDSESPSGSSCPEGSPDSMIEWVSFVQVGRRMMRQVGHADPIPRERLGERLLTTRCRIADRAGTAYQPQSGDATFLAVGTPVYAIAGVDPGFRVVADDDGRLVMFEVMAAEDAETADDVFDIEGNVTAIDVTRRHVVEGTTATGEITGAASIRRFVDELLTAEVASGRQPSTNEVTYRVTLHLREGPPLDLLVYPSDALLRHPWITVPPNLTEQIESAVDTRANGMAGFVRPRRAR